MDMCSDAAAAESHPLIREALTQGEAALTKAAAEREDITRYNHRKMLHAFQTARVSAYHLQGSTGYGLGDAGREALDKVVAVLLGTEAALVRHQFVSGTHAIAAVLFGVLRPGDHFLSVSGLPYDTLLPVIGASESSPSAGSLADWGITFDAVPLRADSSIDLELTARKVRPTTKLFILQRSCGYAERAALAIAEISRFTAWAHANHPGIPVFVDNCYGELVEKLEPPEVGSDIVAGSLIKNLGGTLAPTGGYIAGSEDLVALAAGRFAAPGIGQEVGATLDQLRSLLQGLFFSPLTVSEAVLGMVFTAAFWSALGFPVHPGAEEARTDIVQAVSLGSPERVLAFCRGIQRGCPVDAHVHPLPAPMPGYADEVIMAGGTFIQGATAEFSADAPLRAPYTVFMQGGFSRHYVREANLLAAWEMRTLL
jgi:cystathionine beta-lyase family protein involved in aluminum resistance